MSEEGPPYLAPFEAETRFACGCRHRFDCRRPWATEEWNLEVCNAHGKPRIARYGAPPSGQKDDDAPL